MLRTVQRAGLGTTAVVAALALLAGSAAAAPPFVTITSTGPLGRIDLGNELSCQVAIAPVAPGSGLVGFGSGGQVYGPSNEPADCGTFLSFGGTLYGPDFASHNYTATPFGGATYQAYTPVTQTAPSGSGTNVDPYIVTTVVDAGTTGIRLTEIDTYVTGRQYYRSDVVVTNTTATAKTGLRLYHGLDCYLAGADTGAGVGSPSPATATPSWVGCTGANRTMRLVSLTAGNGYYEENYGTVWSQIQSQSALPNTFLTGVTDNGIAIDWSISLPANGSVIRSFNTEFYNSPITIDYNPKDVLQVNRAAVIVENGDPAPSGGVVVDVSVAGNPVSFSVWIPAPAGS
jgi:hypothetical protein